MTSFWVNTTKLTGLADTIVFIIRRWMAPLREKACPTIPAGTADGAYYVAVMTDADNQLTESDETN